MSPKEIAFSIAYWLVILAVIGGAILGVIEGGGKGATGGAIALGGVLAAMALGLYVIIIEEL